MLLEWYSEGELIYRISNTTINLINANSTSTDSLKRDHLGDEDVDMRIILKLIFKYVAIAYEDVGWI